MKKGAKSENALNENALSGALNSIDKVTPDIGHFLRISSPRIFLASIGLQIVMGHTKKNKGIFPNAHKKY